MSEWLYRYIYLFPDTCYWSGDKQNIYIRQIYFVVFRGIVKTHNNCRGEIGRKEPQIPDLGSYDPERPPTHELSQGINSAGFN